MGVFVRPGLVIPDGEIVVRFGPSGGPGGQHANRSNTRVEMSWNVAESTVLTDRDKSWLIAKFGTTIRLSVDDERSQLRNRDLAEKRLGERVASGLRRPKNRRSTKPTRGSKRRRLDSKRQRGRLKEQRRRPGADD